MFHRIPELVGLHSELYGMKTAAFHFARALKMTAEFFRSNTCYMQFPSKHDFIRTDVNPFLT
jgi:hypothetical protein